MRFVEIMVYIFLYTRTMGNISKIAKHHRTKMKIDMRFSVNFPHLCYQQVYNRSFSRTIWTSKSYTEASFAKRIYDSIVHKIQYGK